jgi:hypothetical protein
VVVGGEGAQPQLLDELVDPRLPVADPLAAPVDFGALEGAAPGATAHALAGLEHLHVEAALLQLEGRGEARDPGSDHEAIGVFHWRAHHTDSRAGVSSGTAAGA